MINQRGLAGKASQFIALHPEGRCGDQRTGIGGRAGGSGSVGGSGAADAAGAGSGGAGGRDAADD
jgi:hypothetical protein